MRAVRAVERRPRVVEVDEPSGDGVLVEVVASSICGTDAGLIAMGSEGYTLGHEFAGLVDGVPYAVEPSIWCGTCTECVAGHTQRCIGEHGYLGVFIDGGLSERIRVPASHLTALPDGLDVADACLTEPMSVSWHGMRRAAVEPGERVAVVGGGSIGLLAVAAARALGHEVALEARHAHQHDAGHRLGGTTPVREYDVVIEAAGSESGLRAGAELAPPGARVVLLGVFHGFVPVPGVTTLVKELTWVAAMAHESDGATMSSTSRRRSLPGIPTSPPR